MRWRAWASGLNASNLARRIRRIRCVSSAPHTLVLPDEVARVGLRIEDTAFSLEVLVYEALSY